MNYKDVKDIFDTENTDDLSSTTIKELRVKSMKSCSTFTNNVRSLFCIKKVLSISEILVGIERKFKLTTTKRAKIRTVLYGLERRGEIKRVKGMIGIYQKKNM